MGQMGQMETTSVLQNSFSSARMIDKQGAPRSDRHSLYFSTFTLPVRLFVMTISLRSAYCFLEQIVDEKKQTIEI